MSNPYFVQRRARRAGNVDQATFEMIDAGRLAYLADVLEECGRPGAAARARAWASEHEMTADRLRGAVAIGAGEDDAAVTASAIAFGGPLPAGVA